MKAGLIVLLLLPVLAWADGLRLASIFQDHAVLQRAMPLPVWGTANPGEKVRVTFQGQQAETKADAEGKWRVTLAPLSAASEGTDLTVEAGETLRIRDVLVGEVWLCSGQSNMEWNVARASHAAEEIAAADFPLIRVIKVGVVSAMPPAASIARGQWKVCRPETVGGFTAVGYHFARELHADLGVPVGIIDSTWGGTSIEAWLNEETLLADPALAGVFERWSRQIATFPSRYAAVQKKIDDWAAASAAAKARGESFLKSRPVDFWSLEARERPMGLYGGMIAPLVPYAIRGAAWYQGENNARNASDYGTLLSALIKGWRQQWGEGDFPFLVVQLPNYAGGNPAGDSWPRLREGQAQAVQTQPNTALAVTIDIGDPTDVHPLNKRAVGRRLALLARAKYYGRTLDAEGPSFAALESLGSALRVRFAHAAGLHCTGGELLGFEIAGEDRRFVAAEAVIDGDDAVRVSARDVPLPVAVRYAWRNAPETNLYNAAQLPAAPFRSDHWPAAGAISSRQ